MTTTVTRQIVRIDEESCNGCGLCVSPCAEGAIQIVEGKAKVIREELCDGAGFCLGVCPTGALTFGDRSDILNLASARVEELKKNGNKNVELYGLSELEGLQMVYVLSEGKEDSQSKYGLPENPRVPASAQVWSYVFKPVRAFLVMVLAFALWVNKSESKHAE